MTKRLFDIFFSFLLLMLFLPFMLLIALFILLFDKGNPIYWSKRVGINNIHFLMPKFRTMKMDTPQVATHLLENPKQFLIFGGNFLRKSSFDELPQLFSILWGDMSFVGPRPALYNQDDLINLRTKNNVHLLRPGLTGLAQISGRDELPIPIKVNFDREYYERQTLLFDLKIILLTVLKVLKRDGVTH